jgi:hypothetical protein
MRLNANAAGVIDLPQRTQRYTECSKIEGRKILSQSEDVVHVIQRHSTAIPLYYSVSTVVTNVLKQAGPVV